jgi:O-antigen ligase
MPLLGEMPRLAIGTEYYLFGGAGLISLVAFGALILVPALGAYGRTWEKATAAILSVFVLAVLVLLGVAVGVLIVYFWPQITQIIPGLD